ncbi:MAG: hypothetical protein HKN50_02975 [Gammaproteobacteria bacterium]|nr:hypothetical protein [Gammaproteobacteria bacterium]
MNGFDPDKLVVMFGMPRGGSTSMYHILDKHPGCFVPFRKETAYFSFNHHKGEAWYRGLFRDRLEHQPGFDISPQYFGDLRSIERIRELAPNAKVILSLRDPVEFIISSYYQTNKFEKKADFKAFVHGYTITGENEVLNFNFSNGYIEKAVTELAQAFGRNVLFYDFKLFREEPVRVLNAIEDFVDVNRFVSNQNYEPVKVNSTYQRNNRLLHWILSRESVISAIDLVFPRSFIKRVRLAVDKITMPGVDLSEKKIQLSDEEKSYAAEVMKSDKQFVDDILAQRRIFTGDMLDSLGGQSKSEY